MARNQPSTYCFFLLKKKLRPRYTLKFSIDLQNWRNNYIIIVGSYYSCTKQLMGVTIGRGRAGCVTAAVRAGRSATSAGAVAEYSPYSV